VVERGVGEVVDRMPACVVWHVRVDPQRNEPEIGRGDLALPRRAAGIAVRRQLLQMGDLAYVHLGGQVAADRLLQALGRPEHPAGQDPPAGERLAGPLPQQRLKPAVAYLQDDGESDVRGSGRMRRRFATHRYKLAERATR
jgi:hypothetical protein